ncbi:hypothetical protein SCUCBS95973_001609 [Sporothrix curviconia]|uniref:CRIB domain-containing protein n=1 Tax=Sporothrix curviconia TaxID=1260050 RepID=A0ABP0B037_9PEZI
MATASEDGLTAASLFSCNGLVAVITGGSAGLGRMMAKALARNGAARIYLLGRRLDVLEAAARDIGHACGHSAMVLPIQADVGDLDALRRAAARIDRETGYVNVVVANAGIEGPASWDVGPDTPLAEVQARLLAAPMADFTHTLHVNTTAAFYTAVSMLHLLDAGNRLTNVPQSSQVIAVSSAAGFSRRISAGFAYSASKAAVIHTWKQLATFLAPYGIRANVYAPGTHAVIDSDMSAPLLASFPRQPDDRDSVARSEIPVGRAGTEDDVAGVILHMVSRAGAFLNGSVILADGGRTSITPAAY